MPVGPERRQDSNREDSTAAGTAPAKHHHHHQHPQHRMDPYGRPGDKHHHGVDDQHDAGGRQPAHGITPGVDAATQSAIAQAAAAAAAAAMAQQQQAAAMAAAFAQQQAAAMAAQQAVAAQQQRRPQAPMPVALPGMPDFVKVSQQSDPRKVAGKLAHTCREHPAPAMLTIGSNCINQAVKAIAIARGYLAESQIELTFQTAFREGGTPERPSVALYLSKHPASRWAPVPGATELAVSGSSQPAVVAGALASHARDGSPVALVGIGVDAVSNAVLAVGHARLALEPDGKDVRVWPEFIKVQKATGELNAIRLNVAVDAIR